jgi:hypothetical protein
MKSLMCSIFLLLASQLLAGCVDRVEPTSSELDVAGTAFIDPPDITLPRNVSLEHGTKTVRVKRSDVQGLALPTPWRIYNA